MMLVISVHLGSYGCFCPDSVYGNESLWNHSLKIYAYLYHKYIIHVLLMKRTLSCYDLNFE